jgi:hypothetical protein
VFTDTADSTVLQNICTENYQLPISLLINLLYQPAWTILVKLGEINMTPPTQFKLLLQGKMFALSSTSI